MRLPRPRVPSGRGRWALVAVVVLLVVAAGTFAATRLLGSGPPRDAAARLVPATALLYAHLSTDPDRDEDRALLESLGRFSALGALEERLGDAVGQDFDLGRDVRPWLGDEAAFALLDTASTRADSLLLLSVRDRARADAFLERAAGSRGTTTYRGVEVRRYTGVSVAFAGGFLAIGQDASVRAAIDRSQGRGAALSGSVAYRRATAERPEERTLDVVLPAEGVQRVLAPAPGVLGALGGVLADPALVSVGASVLATDDGLRVVVRQARREGEGGDFEPVLLDDVPRAAAAYLGVNGLDAFAALVPPDARTALGKAFTEALSGAALDLERDLLEPLRGEAALSVTPGLPVPAVTLVARTSDEARTREALARLQIPIAERLAPPVTPDAPQPTFQQRTLGEVTAFSLAVAPGVDLTYAVHDGRLIVSSQANGVGHVLADRASLRDSPAFERAVTDLPDRVEAVLFADLGQLLALAEQAGSTGDPAFEAVRDDLRRVRVASAVVQREETDSTAELFFEIP